MAKTVASSLFISFQQATTNNKKNYSKDKRNNKLYMKGKTSPKHFKEVFLGLLKGFLAHCFAPSLVL